MAKNIMVSNKVYEEMKRIKGKRSFSEVIAEALRNSGKKSATMGDLLKFAGVLKGDREYDEIMKWSRKRWDEWQKKSA